MARDEDIRKNASGYSDPTAYQAIKNVDGEDEKEEKTFVSLTKQHGIFPKDSHQIHTKSLYKPPFVQVPKHLVYQRRHYQS